MTEDMKTRMVEALKGNFERRDYNAMGKYVLSESERKRYGNKGTESHNICYWEDLFIPDKDGKLEKKMGFFHAFDDQQAVLEAFVLIPEEQGLAKVERVVDGTYWEKSGFLRPEYEEEAIEAIQDSASKYFEDSTDIYHKRFVMKAAIELIPEHLEAFREKYRERILNGLMNVELKKEDREIEALWANITHTVSRLGFSSKDPDFVKAVWEKSKTIPYGYLYGGYGAQVILAEELLNKDPNGLLEFDYIRKGLIHANLPVILSTIPVRKDNVEMQEWRKRRGYPGEETYSPIVDFMNRTIDKEGERKF